MQKYNTKSERRASEYVPSDNRYTPLRSPNGNVSLHGHAAHTGHSGHGHHHYSHVADDRGYATSRNTYMPKGSEKERDRDYKSSRNKYMGKNWPLFIIIIIIRLSGRQLEETDRCLYSLYGSRISSLFLN